MRINTLATRLVLFTSMWMIIALVFIAFVVTTDFRNNSEKQFGKILFANLYNLMGSFEINDNAELIGAPSLGDGRYLQFKSGWYWTVHQVQGDKLLRSSASLAGQNFSNKNAPTYDTNFQRSFLTNDGAENELLVVQAQVFLGESDDLYRFTATGNIGILSEEISEFTNRLILLLVAFGAGLIATSFFVVRFGLNPIRTATSQLSEIRVGNAEKIEGVFPSEIAPLINEANALIKSNHAIVERSRTQVGNLAHSLKTPLSVSKLELAKLPKKTGQLISSQLTAMQDQIQTYLNRAMISARHGTITSRTDVTVCLEKMVSVFSKLYPHLEFEYDASKTDPIIFAGEQQDFDEIIGNILENAGKFAKKKIIVELSHIGNGDTRFLMVTISDDGNGLTEDEIDFVQKRGNRLDENKPGSGLGLSIVKDIVSEYDGQLEIGKSELGGIKVSIYLPKAQGQ